MPPGPPEGVRGKLAETSSSSRGSVPISFGLQVGIAYSTQMADGKPPPSLFVRDFWSDPLVEGSPPPERGVYARLDALMGGRGLPEDSSASLRCWPAAERPAVRQTVGSFSSSARQRTAC